MSALVSLSVAPAPSVPHVQKVAKFINNTRTTYVGDFKTLIEITHLQMIKYVKVQYLHLKRHVFFGTGTIIPP